MYNRERLLIAIIKILKDHGRLDKLTLIKVMFLINMENPPSFSMYGFHSQKYGPFSYKIYSDLTYFGKKYNLNPIPSSIKNNYTIENSLLNLARITKKQRLYIESVIKKFPKTNILIDYIYDKYPEYTLRSIRKNIPHKIKSEIKPSFFLIGYEGVNIDQFLQKLILKNVSVLVDVRFNAHSMKYSFSKNRLKKALNTVEIEYKHIPELGIQGEKRMNLKNQEDYEKLFEEYRLKIPEKKKF